MVFRRTALLPFAVAVSFASHARANSRPIRKAPQQQPAPAASRAAAATSRSPQPQVAPQPVQPQPYPPPQQQPYPPPQQQPYPPQQQQPYPQQQQPYPPQQQQPYPPQQQPPQQQPYPPQQQPYPPQQQPYPPQQLPPPGYAQQPPPGYVQQPPPLLAPPVPSGKRDDREMLLLYGTSVAWGIGSGIWVDMLANVSDPGMAFIAPLAFGAAAPIAMYLWDNYDHFDRGVPSSIATGLTLGAIEGIAISGTQWQNTGNGGPSTWSFQAQSTLTWAISTVGGIGGYFFGEYAQPDPRTISFIVSGAGWGAMSGALLGAGGESPGWWGGSGTNAPQSFGDGASVGGLVGYNAGILATGVASLAGWVPSWRTQQAMWLGYLLGTAGASLVYLFYIGQPDVHHGMIANGLGGLAGVGVAAAVTANMKDAPSAKAWTPPFQLGLAPAPYGGAALAASGSW